MFIVIILNNLNICYEMNSQYKSKMKVNETKSAIYI